MTQNYRPLKQEHQPQPLSLFSKANSDDQSFFKKDTGKESNHTSITLTKSRCLTLLYTLQNKIQDKHKYPQAASKAFEWAKQKVDGGITGISYVEETLGKLSESVQNTSFSLDTSIGIALGYDFLSLTVEQKLYRMMERSLRKMGLPPSMNPTSSGDEYIDKTKAWTEYVLSLCELLSEDKPYLITGTPIPQQKMERKENEGPERSNRLGNRIQAFFKKITQKEEEEKSDQNDNP